MGETHRGNRTLNCPKCGEPLKGEEENYAFVYVCEPCGIIILDLKIKLKNRD